MSDDSSTQIIEARRDWTAEHKAMYLESGGAEGHIVDVTAIGGRPFTTTLLLKYVGRKSGKTMIAPLIYGDTGGEVVIVASKGGADEHPAWYLNIKDAEEVEFQVATQAFRATLREPSADERARVWDFMAALYPPYTDYQASTDREIPLVMLSPIAEVPAFQA